MNKYLDILTEALVFLFTCGAAWGFFCVWLNRHLREASWLGLALALAFGWLVTADVAFYAGYPSLVMWPVRPGIFRGSACLAVWVLIWRSTKGARWRG